MKNLIITIDGPAGSGKTTIAKALAQKFKLDLLESGAFYRYLTWRFIKDSFSYKITIDDEVKNKIKEFLSDLIVNLSSEGTQLIYRGRILKEELRAKEVENAVSEISALPVVREEITNYLRKIVKNKKIITEGRDMGSYVFPSAEIKFFLTAELEERVKRRLKDTEDRDEEEIRKNLLSRDKRDSEREIAPLKIPEKAIIIDTTHLTVDEVIERMVPYLQKYL